VFLLLEQVVVLGVRLLAVFLVGHASSMPQEAPDTLATSNRGA
jgi:hypothetical protein